MPIDRVFGVGKKAPPSSEPPDDNTDERTPIGVPKGYTTVIRPVQDTGTQYRIGDRTEVGPRYFDGDQFTPGGASPESIADLQRDLIKAGLIGASTNIRLGVWDIPTQKAYEQLLATSNARGYDANTTLNDMLAAPQTHPAGSKDAYQAPPLQLKTTNKDDLKRVFRGAVIDQLGEGWSQAQINELVDAYNWQEIAVQKQAYDQTVALDKAAFEGGPGGGTITEPSMPSPETFIEDQMRAKDPVGFEAGQVTNEFIPQIMGHLNGWV